MYLMWSLAYLTFALCGHNECGAVIDMDNLALLLHRPTRGGTNFDFQGRGLFATFQGAMALDTCSFNQGQVGIG